MKLDILDMEDFVDINELQEVSSPVIFQRGGIPHTEGLLSNIIFGSTVVERKQTFAYIDLGGHFFHPHVYKVIRSLFRAVDQIISGEEYYIIEDGVLKKDESGETGIEFLYNNWEKIKFGDPEESVGIRSERLDLLSRKKKELFIDKLVVLPVFYRDIKTDAKGGGKTGDLNNFYTAVIRSSNIIKDRGAFDFAMHSANKSIQNNINNIYEYFKVKLEKKQGMFRKYLMGKTVSYSVRSVISAKNFHDERPEDAMVTYEYCGIPMAQILAGAYPFVQAWLLNFFRKELVESQYTKILSDTGEQLELDNPESYFTDKYIHKMVNNFIKNPESRFDPIEVPVKNSKKKCYLMLTGFKLNDSSNEDDSTIVNRRMTVTDLLYICAVDISKDKHCLVTRYPLSDSFNVIATKLNVSSTTETIVVKINDTIYKWYPVINENLKRNRIATFFIDSLQMSTCYLEAMGGDFDGDQVTFKLLWTQEANAELHKFIRSKFSFSRTNRTSARKVGTEITQCIYTMTKDPSENSRVITQTETEWLLSQTPDDFTFSKMTMMFANTESDKGLLQNIPKFKPTDIVTIPGFHVNEKTPVKTTVGRYVTNMVLFKKYGFDKVIPYQNVVMTDGYFGKIENMINSAMVDNKITMDQVIKWNDIKEWFGMSLHAVVTTSFTRNTIMPNKEVMQLKKELLKKYEKEIKAGDVSIAQDIETALIKKTKEVLKDDTGLDLYNSGARGSIGNNLKNMAMMRGSVKDPVTGKFKIVTSSLMEGTKKDEFAAASNTILNGAYPKSVGTAVTGYLGKQLLASMQTEVLAEKDSECGTKAYMNFEVTDANYKDLIDRYIINQSGKLVIITEDMVESLIGKTIKLRSPMMCIGIKGKICNHCIGDLFYKLGIENAGMQAIRISTTLTNLNMKKFHDNVIKMRPINIDKLIL